MSATFHPLHPPPPPVCQLEACWACCPHVPGRSLGGDRERRRPVSPDRLCRGACPAGDTLPPCSVTCHYAAVAMGQARVRECMGTRPLHNMFRAGGDCGRAEPCRNRTAIKPRSVILAQGQWAEVQTAIRPQSAGLLLAHNRPQLDPATTRKRSVDPACSQNVRTIVMRGLFASSYR